MPATIFRLLLLMAALLIVEVGHPDYISRTAAQTNLLQNPGFNDAAGYIDRRPSGSTYAYSIAPGWNGWFTKSPSTANWMNLDPIASAHTGGLKREGDASQTIRRGNATFTAAAYQVIDDIPAETTLRFRAWVFQESRAGSGAQTRIGIGSDVSGNPLADDITWSDWMTAINRWQLIDMQAVVPAGNATVFIYSTQSQPADPNRVYYDQAVLEVVSADDSDAATVVPAATGTPTPQFAPFAEAQPSQATEPVVHIVEAGDTLSSLALRYGVSIDQIRQLNNLSSDILQIGQQLTIRAGSSDNASPEPATTAAPAIDIDATTDPADEAVADASTPDEAGTSQAAAENSPTPTIIVPTPTPAAAAPVQEGRSDADPLSTETGVCVVMYVDANQNRIRENSERLLADGTITLVRQAGEVTSEYVTDGESEPYCFDELPAGAYQAAAQAPTGYGLTTSNRLIVNVLPGSRLRLNFGAAEGVEVASAPTPDATPTAIDADLSPGSQPDVSGIREILGVVVLALAGIVLLGGAAAAFVMRVISRTEAAPPANDED